MERTLKTIYPRDAALKILIQVLSEHQALEDALAPLSAAKKLSPTERAWLQEITAGTLRWKGRLELAIDSAALKKKPSGWLRKALLLAAYQLIAQDRVNPGAVVSETVSEIKKKEGESPAKFANAVLRKIADHASEWRNLARDPAASAKESAGWASLPEWLWNKCFFQHGTEWAARFAEAALERPKIWIRVKDGRKTPEWAEAGPVPGSAMIQEGGAVFEKSGFREGDFFVQDISSQFLVSEISREVRDSLGSGFSALDLCAAPGGKSIGLAWSGARVTATDKDSKRLSLLRGSIERAAPEVKVVPRDEISDLAPQDLVWVDAPCTGTGIVRRHPDVRWLRREQDVAALVKTQEALFLEAWEKTRPGGFLAYTVCSILKEEGPGVTEKALKKIGPGAVQVREWLLAPHLAPYGDGFWGVLIRREKA